MENQKRKLEDAVQTIQSISKDGQAPPPNSDSQDWFEPISRKLKNIEDAMSREFLANFGTANREDKLDTLLDELKSKNDDLTSGRSQSQPQHHGNTGNLRPALLLGLVGKDRSLSEHSHVLMITAIGRINLSH